MKSKELLNIGFPQGPIIGLLLHACHEASSLLSSEAIREIVRDLYIHPELYREREIWDVAAEEMYHIKYPDKQMVYEFVDKPFKVFGAEYIEKEALEQMSNAMRLPVSVSGACLPDAHLGYGICIGGVLALDNAVSPYCVGVDIACRMMMTILPLLEGDLHLFEDDFVTAVEKNTRFGKGASFTRSGRKKHPIMDEDWNFAKPVAELKNLAWEQLGTSGSGNHFLDIGIIEFPEAWDITPAVGFSAGTKLLAILTHSGSRGAGNKIATYYSKVAQSLHPKLPPEYKHLAWLNMDSEAGQEYWHAMQLMGRYASACHHLIHEGMLKTLKLEPVFRVENHHNFAWKENHDGKEVIVHRKGATPAGLGEFGIIPGSMATPGFLVEGKGNESSLCSASHGAGRAMSRKKTKENFRWSSVKGLLKERGVRLISAGLDEVPGGYKDIRTVMAAQSDLVQVVAKFTPRIVKMADDGTSED